MWPYSFLDFSFMALGLNLGFLQSRTKAVIQEVISAHVVRKRRREAERESR